MTEEDLKNPKVFISYSWSSQEYEAFIIEIAERLRGDGIDVVLDKWDFHEGQDKHFFMQRIVNDPEINKVLIFSDKLYQERADSFKGGVGTETQIISQEVYAQVEQQKFIPLACEWNNEKNEPYFPAFLKARKYIDFSNTQKYLENYQMLVRAIYNKPLFKKPELGKTPDYILEPDKPSRWSKVLLESLKNAVLMERTIYKGLSESFLNTYIEKFEEFRLTSTPGKEFDEQFMSNIEAFLPFRDDFVAYFDFMVQYKNEPHLYQNTVDFLERSLTFFYSPQKTGTWNEQWADNYRFIIQELFLYITVILVKKRYFSELSFITDHLYYVPQRSVFKHGGMEDFTFFSAPCGTLNRRNQRLKSNRVSLQADILMARATVKNIPSDQIVQAEGLLFLKSLVKKDLNWIWAPQTLIYAGHGTAFEVFARAASKKHFNELSKFLGVASKEDLLKRFDDGYEREGVKSWQIFWHAHLDFKYLYNFQNLDTK